MTQNQKITLQIIKLSSIFNTLHSPNISNDSISHLIFACPKDMQIDMFSLDQIIINMLKKYKVINTIYLNVRRHANKEYIIHTTFPNKQSFFKLFFK